MDNDLVPFKIRIVILRGKRDRWTASSSYPVTCRMSIMSVASFRDWMHIEVNESYIDFRYSQASFRALIKDPLNILSDIKGEVKQASKEPKTWHWL